MACWITRYEGVPGWERLVKCTCSSCGRSANRKLVIDMDGESMEYDKSKYCPNCGELMTGEVKQRFL